MQMIERLTVLIDAKDEASVEDYLRQAKVAVGSYTTSSEMADLAITYVLSLWLLSHIARHTIQALPEDASEIRKIGSEAHEALRNANKIDVAHLSRDELEEAGHLPKGAGRHLRP